MVRAPGVRVPSSLKTFGDSSLEGTSRTNPTKHATQPAIHLVKLYSMSYRTDTKALVLAVLADGPKHGYAISKEIKLRSDEALKLGEGQLYPILHALEEQGWIKGEWEIQDGDPPRKVYLLLDAGKAELEKRSKEWLSFTKAVAAVIGKKTEPAHE